MLIANPKQSALGWLNLGPRVLITKVLVSAAIALGSYVVGPAPAGADPNPFGGLTCNCQGTAPGDSPLSLEELERGIRDGLQTPITVNCNASEFSGGDRVHPQRPL